MVAAQLGPITADSPSSGEDASTFGRLFLAVGHTPSALLTPGSLKPLLGFVRAQVKPSTRPCALLLHAAA